MKPLAGKPSIIMPAVLAAALCALCLLALAGCGSEPDGADASSDGPASGANTISVYSREDGSGTRGAFVELFGLEEEDPNGVKHDMTTDKAAITNSTAVMMSSVAGDPDAIGYLSLGSLNDSVKALAIDGVEATAAAVKDGSYKVSRPFNIVMTEDASDLARDFEAFIMSAEGQAIVEENKYIPVNGSAASYTPSGMAGKVVVAGSSSVTPVMEFLAEAYERANPNVSVEVQQSDSTTGVSMALAGTCDIGMASRDLKDSETASGAVASSIARDGIAVIVAPGAALDGLTSDQVKAIFSGQITDWSQIRG